MEYDIDNIIKNMDFSSNMLNDIGNGIFLSNREIDVLNRYSIDYKSCLTLKEIIYRIESVIEECEDNIEDLDYISSTISERDYYQNTNK